MTAIGDDLRGIIKKTRLNPVIWGSPRGLTQRELADLTGTSQVWIRQIESGYKDSASPNTLGTICYKLGVDEEWLRIRGYDDVAEIVATYKDTDIMLGDGERRQRPSSATERHLRTTPGLTTLEKDQLVDALREIRRTEPLGKDIWRRSRKP